MDRRAQYLSIVRNGDVNVGSSLHAGIAALRAIANGATASTLTYNLLQHASM